MTRDNYGILQVAPIAGLIVALKCSHLTTRLIAVLAFVFCIVPDSVYAEEPISLRPSRETIEELRFLKEETVVTAVRHEQPLSQSPSNVYVITDEDIRQSGATDIPTLLRRVPGMEVIQITGAEFIVSARGDNQLQANKMLVMVDGRSIYNDVQGFVLWKAIPVTLPEIRQIEVLKGPASAVYGFNAFDGVVNIITKSPEEMKGTTAQFGGGEYGTIMASAIQAGTAGKLGYRVSVGRDQNQEWRDRDALAFRSNKFNLHTEYNLPAASRLLASGGLVDVNRFDGVAFESSLARSNASQAYASLGYERSSTFVRAYWMQSVYNPDIVPHPLLDGLFHGTDSNGGFPVSFRTNTYNVDVQDALQVGSTLRITYGLNYRHNTVSGNGVDRFATEDRVGPYLQNEWTPVKEWTVVAGIRYDMDTFIHPTVSPRIAILLSPTPEQVFRAAFSVGYRPPTLFETHSDLRFPSPFNPPGTPPLKFLGATNQIPEQIVSYEFGYQQWFLKHRLRVRADLFANLIRDLFDPRTDSPRRSVFLENALGKANIVGGEASLEFLVTSWLSGFVNYSYQQFNSNFSANVTRAGPPFTVNGGLRGEWENGLSSEVTVYHVAAATYPIDTDFRNTVLFGNPVPDPRVGSYNLLNVRGAYRFLREKAEAAVSIFNALNDRHKEHPLGDTIGTRVMGWITIRF
jgi:iron complex outermembrane receptor protein